MTENLKKIQSMIEATKESLNNCKPVSLKESDIDKAAKSRALLKDKLALLESEEQKELQAIAEAEAIDKQRRRESLFRSIIKNHQKDEERYCSFNKEIQAKLEEVFTLMIEKDALFSAKSLGIKTADLDSDERKALFDQLQGMRPSAAKHEKDFGGVWSLAIEKTLPDDTRLYSVMKSFPENPSQPASMKAMPFTSIRRLCEEWMTSSSEDIETENTVNP
ncbi:hypothetical protein [Vibrio parahaemolyticus]|uniref:hypothetical protein n=1 Tax=Vibrio parahaemolyticus TaxID=670 RepID=UPI000A3D2250|nr:hypothetical protein [Vibrio parahaemolyticus]MDF4628409.1 hypothetical protein [Vibrio parahaemolyticus]OUJ37926.1 hypothetical protein BTZ05_24390 [Vibrio parahaemolyticus]TOJ81546.1 hypothetical protein CGI32_19845 [Vibrio parahaemolyticus]